MNHLVKVVFYLTTRLLKDTLYLEFFESGNNEMKNKRTESPSLVMTIPYYSRAERKKMSRLSLICFLTITKSWGLADKEKMCLIGIKSKKTLRRYEKNEGVALSIIQLELVSYVIRIYKALGMLFFNLQKSQEEWMKKKNDFFNGQSAMEYIMSSDIRTEKILDVVQYLEGQLQ